MTEFEEIIQKLDDMEAIIDKGIIIKKELDTFDSQKTKTIYKDFEDAIEDLKWET